jgi:hypothetical protein
VIVTDGWALFAALLKLKSDFGEKLNKTYGIYHLVDTDSVPRASCSASLSLWDWELKVIMMNFLACKLIDAIISDRLIQSDPE